jgi:hypothetical protein
MACAAEDGSQPESVTLLSCFGDLRMAKAYEIAGNFVAITPYPNAKYFVVTAKQINGISDVHRMLLTLETWSRTCIIRGAPIEGINRDHAARKGNFVDVPRHWVMVDMDKLPAPPGVDLLADPADAARRLFDLLVSHAPELEGVSAVVQFSASAGIREMAEAAEAAGLPPQWDMVAKRGGSPTISAHVWLWLAVPQDGKALKRWAEAINDRAGFGLIDCLPFGAVQPHYTAAPIFGPKLRDPLAGRRTHLIEGEAEAATLDIPAVPTKPERGVAGPSGAGGQAFAGAGYSAKLAAIGGPGGFQGTILSAVASFVATNWPNPDIGKLIADIQARVAEADPGDRSPAQIDRYASDAFIRDKAESRINAEEAKRAAMAEEAAAILAASEPMPPTFPDRGVSLDKAKLLAGAAISDFARRVAAGEAPHLLLLVTVGGGKTWAAIDAMPRLLEAGRSAGRGPVLFLHPRHKLGDQIAADIRKAHPALHVAVWRGMDADNPAKAGEAMCTTPILPEAARKASMDATHGCIACPMNGNGCAYQDQAEAGAVRPVDVWVAAHHLMTHAPFKGWPRVSVDGFRVPVMPAAVIVDENPAGNWLAGMDGKKRIKLEAIEAGPTDYLDPLDVRHLQQLRSMAVEAMLGQAGGKAFRDGFDYFKPAPQQTMKVGNATVALLPTKPPGMEWSALEWATKPKVQLPEGATIEQAIKVYEKAAAKGFSSLRAVFGKLIAEFLDSGDERSVTIENIEGSEDTEPMARFTWREDIHPSWQAPAMLYLGATTSPEVLRHWSPELEVCEIEVQAPHQTVVQVPSREFGKTWAVQSGNVSRLADCVLMETARAGGETLAVLQMEAERLLRTELERRGCVREPVPEGAEDDPAVYRFPSGAVLHLAHHGAIEGVNRWEHMATVLVIGRPATDRPTGERYGEVIRGGAVDRVAAENSAWPKRAAAIRLADGSGHRIEQPCHPDPLVEAWRWSVTEGAVIQAIGRARGVRRTAANPLRVVVLASMALPLAVDAVATWDDYQPDRVTVGAAEAALFVRALPLAAADLAKVMGWNIDNAKFHLKAFSLTVPCFNRVVGLISQGIYKGNYPIKSQTRYRYRKGVRGRWSEALAPIEGGRDALEALLGPLAAFEPVPIQAAEPISVAVPGAVLEAVASLDPGSAIAPLPDPEPEPEPQTPPGGRVMPWHRPSAPPHPRVTRYPWEAFRQAG